MYKEESTSINNMILNKKYIDYKYSHKVKPSVSYVLKKSYDELSSALLKSGLKRMIFKVKCQINKSLIFDKSIDYDFGDISEINYEYKNEFKKNRIAVYTAIFGGYDEIKEPLYRSPVCDYFIFTDRDVSENSEWKKISIKKIPGHEEMDAYHLSKFVKIFPHIFFEDYEYSLWVDGTTTIVADVVPFIDRLGENFIGVFDNPVHDCIYTEGNFLIYYNRVKEAEIKKQLADYRIEGFPKHAGMYECTVISRKHKKAECIQMMELWWEQIEKYTMRDQISFPVVAWRLGLLEDGITSLGENRNFNPRLMFDDHLKTHKYN